MSPQVKRRYQELVEQEYRGTLTDRIARFLFLGCMAILTLLYLVLLIWFKESMTSSAYPLSLPLIVAGWQYGVRKQRYHMKLSLAQTGVPVWVTLIQANEALFRKGAKGQVLPCLVVLAFDPRLEQNEEWIFTLARRITALQRFPTPAPPDLAAVTSIVKANENRAEFHRRQRLPPSFTGVASPVYAADLFIKRADLPAGMLTQARLPCIAQPGESGMIELLPWKIVQDDFDL